MIASAPLSYRALLSAVSLVLVAGCADVPTAHSGATEEYPATQAQPPIIESCAEPVCRVAQQSLSAFANEGIHRESQRNERSGDHRPRKVKAGRFTVEFVDGVAYRNDGKIVRLSPDVRRVLEYADRAEDDARAFEDSILSRPSVAAAIRAHARTGSKPSPRVTALLHQVKARAHQIQARLPEPDSTMTFGTPLSSPDGSGVEADAAAMVGVIAAAESGGDMCMDLFIGLYETSNAIKEYWDGFWPELVEEVFRDVMDLKVPNPAVSVVEAVIEYQFLIIQRDIIGGMIRGYDCFNSTK